ncbi:MAG: TlpA disulfide reductase family protein [Desulfobacterales bacterium]|jgi:thiol-disulfide isomerase/thioredoxin
MKKKTSFTFILLTIILLAMSAGVGLHLFYNGFFAIAGSQDQALERLFSNIGILKIPHISRPVEIQLKDVFGNTVSLSEFRGKVVFLNFWATWCPPCIIEMPSMEKLHRRFKDKNFVMVAINSQEADAQVKSFFEKNKLSFTALLDSSGEVGSWFGVNLLPTSFVLDKQGRIIGKAIGPREWDSPASIDLFDYLIDN